MSRLIDFSKYQVYRDPLSKSLNDQHEQNIIDVIDDSNDIYKLTINILVHNNPNKTSFTLEEVARQLNVGTEFVRRRVKAGRIKVIYLGDKPMIHISELARLLTKGIK